MGAAAGTRRGAPRARVLLARPARIVVDEAAEALVRGEAPLRHPGRDEAAPSTTRRPGGPLFETEDRKAQGLSSGLTEIPMVRVRNARAPR
jgi:hypothetical protein